VLLRREVMSSRVLSKAERHTILLYDGIGLDGMGWDGIGVQGLLR
jgi:hypothetical protein